MEINVLMITTNRIGNDSDELGGILLKSFLATLLEKNNFTHLVLLNSGVKITCEGSNVIDDLREIVIGTEILICGTCLNYYDLTKKVEVGQVSNMRAISSLLMDAQKVVNI
jgi:selenium metabolism protein YedF